ncbi:VPLPA-CTERM sorting domain-containing protein [Octadecabacter sp. 1_MG-2023]|uniref:VPLPA-CTERM sorting domain-containing protein n=1 Tax=unclassified Octadecabacter TaxID=196158 RepID=UPI001C0A06F5|nr:MULTISPECIES: VPLPA-CTERM sorting domain-containing protein [unclassified Octadecabacter]MBU2993721.1 VPLPA-CTERM sorting domain-containing protein [Octadecabacter sp. B2R22]MDO6735435.1 VPLPA-CTERM sorting domain-containing protein [Octadecabacter sp. 1_MG-2023]
MNFNIVTSSIAALVMSASMASAASIDLTTWSAEGSGNWTVQSGNDAVLQTINTPAPTVFHNNSTSSQGNDLQGQITVGSTWDDDFIGFVLGYNANDLSNSAASYLLVDWKRGTQDYQGTGLLGLSISQVSGELGNDSGAWAHDPANNVTELARATNLGSTGWNINQTYDFKIDFTATNVKVFVDDVLELDVSGVFADGGFGFYNYSQDNVTYAGITSDVLPDPSPVPLPAAGWMLLASLGGLAAAKRRKQA